MAFSISPFINKHQKPKYTVDELKKKFNSKKKLDFSFFWQIEKEGLQINSLSQWQKSKFVVENICYSCAEHYMMAQKALIFNDLEIYEKILSVKNPKQIKSLGR